MNIKRIASSHFQIVSNEGIKKQESDFQSWKLIKQEDLPKLIKDHHKAMEFREFVFGGQIKKLGQKNDADLEKFLIETNEFSK